MTDFKSWRWSSSLNNFPLTLVFVGGVSYSPVFATSGSAGYDNQSVTTQTAPQCPVTQGNQAMILKNSGVCGGKARIAGT